MSADYTILLKDVIAIKRFNIKIICALLCALLLTAPVSASVSSTIAQKEEQKSAVGNIFEAEISELKYMLEKGFITSEELCQTYIQRINKYDKNGVLLNSVISLNTNAVTQAKQLDKERKEGKVRGVLHGIPILVKDNIDVSGFPTTLGNKGVTTVSESDAAAVAALVSQGAIILGKTNLSTNDATTRYTYSALLGEARNVYNTAYAAGGSSAGAVAVSANFAAASIDTDTNGSATFPAALNGVVSYRPTHALVDYTGAHKVVAARDVISPTAKSVADVALLLDVLTESTDSMTYTKELSTPSLKGKKLAVVTELYKYTYNSPNEFRRTDSEVIALFDKAIEDIKAQGGEVVFVSIPKLFTYFNTCRESAVGSAAAKQALLSELKNLLSQNGADAFVFPSYLSTPFKSGFNDSGLHNSTNEIYMNCGAYLPSLVGLPAISVPMGYLESGVSAGIEFVSLPSNDSALLSIANAYEKATEHRKPSEKTPNLYEPIELKVEEEKETEPEIQDTSSQQQIIPTEKEKDKFKSEIIVVGVIIGAVLILSVWVLVFGRKGRKKDVHKNRHF